MVDLGLIIFVSQAYPWLSGQYHQHLDRKEIWLLGLSFGMIRTCRVLWYLETFKRKCPSPAHPKHILAMIVPPILSKPPYP